MRSTTTTWAGAVGLCAVVLTGCGGGSSKPPATPNGGGWGGGFEEASAPAKSGGYGGGGGAVDEAPVRPSTASPSPPPPGATSEAHASAEAPPSGGSTWSTPEPAPREKERPGLGTEWGETRESHVREVTFFRGEPDRPFAVAQMFYNDRSGVEALAAYHGGAPHFRDVAAANGAITVSIRDAWGESLDAMRVGERTYVVGREGERYSIILSNHTARRIEAVATVDGLDVINGRTGSFSNRGYVLMPWATLAIDGFRQSDDSVAAFRFAKVKDSYAAQTGDARNVGVIGVAFFAERGDNWDGDELRTRDTASPFPRDPRYAQPPR